MTTPKLPWSDLPRTVRRAVAITYRADRRAFLGLVGTSLAITLAGLIQLLVIRDALVMFFDNDLAGPRLWVDLAGILVCTSTLGVAGGLAAGKGRRLAEACVHEAQGTVLEAALAAPLEKFDEPTFHDSLDRSLRQSYDVISVSLGFSGFMTESLASAGLGVALLAIHPLLVPLVVLGYVPLFLATSRSSAEIYSFNFDSTPEDRARNRLQEIIVSRGLAAEVRAFEMSRTLVGHWEELFVARMGKIGALVRAADRRYTTSGIASGALVAATCACLGALFQWGWISGPETAAAAIAIQQIGNRLSALTTSLAEVAEHGVFLEEYERFVESHNETSTKPPPTPVTARSRPEVVPALRDLRLEDVSFRYPGMKRRAVKDVNLTVETGEVLALVGENGSGKSTLAKIIAGLYTPQSGTVSWNGTAYPEIGDDLRASIALLPQEYGRYPFSVQESVALGDATLPRSEDAVWRALEGAGGLPLVEALDDGLDTRLAREFAGGADLSGGQWQRIALARVFYRQSAQLLVLDEPTAALDPRAELDLFTRLRKLGAGRTVVYISHRFATVWQADRIAVMKGGRIVECGPHRALVRQGGLYSELVALQRAQYVGGGRQRAAVAKPSNGSRPRAATGAGE